jgi:antirestriction protein
MSDSPSIYVGTYAKYNAGSLFGKWLDLDDYTCRDDFLKACRELHKNEPDPELMFQDYENFPKAWYSESSAPPDELWEWLDLDDHEKALLEAYQDAVDETGTIEQARDAYIGHDDTSIASWAESYLEDCGDLQNVPESLRNHIDFDSWARDSGFTFHRYNGDLWVFAN